MTKVKLVDGIIINATDVIFENGILKISTIEHTVEELAELFSNKENTSLITFMTESEIETGYKVGFTSFAGINYSEEGIKTVEIFQPIDALEARVSNAEGNIAQTNANVATIAEEVTNTQLALCELYEGGI